MVITDARRFPTIAFLSAALLLVPFQAAQACTRALHFGKRHA
jgi:hypothetical protein